MAANLKLYKQAQRAYRAAFFAGLGEDTSGWSDYVWRLSANMSTKELVLFLSMSRDLPKFSGRREYFEAVFHKLELETDEYLKGFKVREKEFRQDKWGLYIRMAREMGKSVPIAQTRTVWDLLCSGFSGRRGLAYDGQFFFDAEHTTDDGLVQSNAWTLELTPDNYDTVYANLETMRLPNGELAYGGELKTRLMCGPKYRSRCKVMFDLHQNGNNPRYGQSEYRIIQHLSGEWADYWFLMALVGDQESRPLVFKEETPTEFVEQTAPDSDAQFDFRERRYGVNADWGMDYGRFEVIQGSTGADA